MTNLTAFNITYFPSGQKNLQILPGVPVDPSFSTPVFLADAASGNGSAPSSDEPQSQPGTAVMQLFYPQDSIDPGNPDTPEGGADFYATPLDLAGSRGVALEYSVFFPIDFDWVQGGKLPGIYGGKVGCSGGDAAVTCFSTRLMWRAGGAGELYLYAPKDKQTKALCSTPPQSVCDAAYGLSVGRGSFYFAAGNWTRVRQTVILNTPGEQDGGFLLEVNGKPVIDRSDVFYRDAVAAAKTGGSGTNNGDGGSSGSNSGGLLGGLLGGPLRIALWPESNFLVSRDDYDNVVPDWFSSTAILVQGHTIPAADPTTPVELLPTLLPNTTTVQSTSTTTSLSKTEPAPLVQFVTAFETSTAVAYPTEVSAEGKSFFGVAEMQQIEPVGFTGLFFSTFFGGHEQEYASPKDQYAWFSNFSMSIVA
ncbi:hypothetical protein EVJ58_g2772 [Rhodofomes roseus]|uniref:Polysaccharide lyase 14 domain-containing protein n=1 Tax=Rhodofomes roseus TaxID=34475 RepID=A0A4Y9YP43_9APHY|nr:hypothetical protein EVJ58_g2772 [Rhodofomes roseus]